MARPDSGELDRAVCQALSADAELVALMPDGVYFGTPPGNLRRFVLVGLDESIDEGVFGHRAIENVRYVVQAVALSSVVPNISTMRAAAARIDAVLEGDPLPTPAGFGSIDCVREERLAESPVDELDKSLKWHHYGGYYRVTAAWPDTV